MSIYRAIRKAFIVTVTFLLVICVAGFWFLNSSLKEGCSNTLKIAQDSSKVIYLDNWAMQNIVDQGYHFVTGMHGDLWGSNGDARSEIMPLPSFEKSGIELKFFRFNFEKKTGKFNSKITAKNVGRFEFGNGRNQIIVLKNGTTLNSYRGHNQDSGHLLKVSDNVYAYCADSTFEI